jgi:hypothetical protein
VHACRANLTTELEEKWAAKPASKPFKDSKKDTVNAVDFQLNRKLYLATQQCGGGFTEVKVIAGMLGLHNNPLQGRWKQLGNEIGQEIIALGQDVIEENVLIEMELSPEDEKGKKKLSGCGDCRWDKRSSGRRYDSCSGCCVVIGGRAQVVLGIAAMSNKCNRCTRGLPHAEELCPKNVECSSKGMEAIGCAEIVADIFENYDAYIHEYVGDDDSSTKKVLRHNWQQEMDKGIFPDVPRDDDGKKLNDMGLLPITHPEIHWLADKGHRVRQFASKLFKLCGKKKAECEGNNLDAERLKRNLSFAIRINCMCRDIQVLKDAVESVLEHHFNDHRLCGEWCQVKNLVGQEREEARLRYRNKEKNANFYLQVKEIFEEFYLLLEEMMHEFDTNIVEGMNKFFTKFLPKDRTYAMSIENSVRLYLAVCIDSVGYTETYR